MSDLNRATLRRFFVLGYDDLRARLARRFGSVELASDALHETWLRLETAVPAGIVRSPRNYLLQMAANVALKRLKVERSFVTLTDAKMAIGISDDAPDPECAAIASSEVAMLAKALSELTPRRREILLASRLDGIQLWAIAERLGVSQRLVEIELKHALAHCALRVDRNVIKRFGPRSPQGSQAEEEDPG
ncbi:sigma-70 family RNA polymerase sigma factor [Bradyrhizobium sp. WSM 1738]|uniref:RNA polymerase sigma factor n=1 Tax=Bradyrhizobium hereditatis TaxID=2821405 RepID=UPI001CE390F4|nr:sigma-70 family RNA polymerase sigma factor [Bradyrhizobium hereditatis]MCA6116448.1 sigma-70 family RNA polymerase sigma factor [Bradyrhizobium hereditatis]